MNHWIPTTVLLLFAFALTPLHAQKPPSKKDDPRAKLVVELGTRVMQQRERTEDGETLQQSWSSSLNEMPDWSTVIVKLDNGIGVVTEVRQQLGYYTQKDYHLHEGAVYAVRVTHHAPYMDGKTHRISQSWLLFDKDTPFYRSSVTARLPLDQSPEDIYDMKGASPERESTPPPGLEGWGKKLTARAYDLARIFHHGVGRHAIDPGGWMFKNAPPEGSGVTPERTADWLPPADTLILPVLQSESPDGIFSIGWGYEKGPVDWAKLRTPSSENSEPTPEFTSKIAIGPVTGDLENDANYLLNHFTGQPIVKLGFYYPGERQRFNHDELLTFWSPNNACVVVLVTAKWESEFAHIAWIKDGVCDGSQDIMEPLQKAARDATLKSKHPSAKRLRDENDFMYSLDKILVDDNGAFEAKVSAVVPKLDSPSSYFETVIEGVISPGPKDGPAALKVTKSRVLPIRP